MMDKFYYSIIGYFAERTKVILNYEQVQIIKKLRKLAIAYQRQAENECNGKGYIPRKGFFSFENKNAYVSEDKTVFDVESERLREKIEKTVQELSGSGLDNTISVKFQGDPRGFTVKLYFNISTDISEILY